MEQPEAQHLNLRFYDWQADYPIYVLNFE